MSASDRRVFGERLLRLALRCHPVRFRQAFGDEMIEYYRDTYRRESATRGRLWAARFLGSAIRSAIVEGWRQRRGEPRGSGAGRARAGLRADMQAGWRTLRRQPGFAAGVIVVLTLGLGANTAVFGALDAVLLQPLPYPDPDRLVRVYQTREGRPGELEYVTAPAFEHFRDTNRTFESLAALYTYSEQGADVTDGFRSDRLRVLEVTPAYFPLLGFVPVRGRLVSPDDEGGPPVAVVRQSIADRYAAGSSPARIALDDVSHLVIGVLPDDAADPIVGRVDAWLLLPIRTARADGTAWASWQWDNHYLTVIGRLRPGVALDVASTDVARMSALQGEIEPDAAELGGIIRPLQQDLKGEAGSLLWLLTGAAGVLFLIACVNTTGLIVARGVARRRELAVRVALGASRSRLVRQLLVETLVLSLAAGLAGVALGAGLSALVAARAPVELSGGLGTFNFRVFGVILVVAAAAGAGASLVPALRLTRIDAESVLREQGRSGGQAPIEGRSRNMLVVAQIALSLVLLVGAGLMIKAVARLQEVDIGFRPAELVTYEVNLPEARYDAPGRIRFHQALHARLEARGLRTAALSHVPATGGALSWGVRRADAPDIRSSANQRVVEGGAFELLGIPLVAGRVFDASDSGDAPRRIVINSLLAERLFAGGPVIGRHLVVAGATLEIIGVVGDTAIDARGEVVPIVYHAHRQFGGNRNWRMAQIVTDDGDQASLFDIVRSEVAAIDLALVPFRPRMLASDVSRGRAREQFAAALLTGFAALAGILSAVGLYGTLASGVARRRHEFAVRMALGAGRRTIYAHVARRGALLTAAGVVPGLAGAWAGARALGTLLFDVSPHDAGVFVAATLLLAATAAAATWLPARAAARVDPAAAFK